MKSQTTPFITAALFLLTVMAANVAANPTGNEPNRPLSAHGTIPAAKDMVTSLYALYAEHEKSIAEMHDRGEKSQRYNEREISKAAGRLWKARRAAEHLKLMGEPAGWDLEKKLTILAIEVDKLGLAFTGTPKGPPFQVKLRTKLNREMPRLKKFLTQAQGALKQGKLEVFNTQMEIKGVYLAEQLVFFTISERKKYNGDFNTVLAIGDDRLKKKRKDEYMKVAQESISKQLALAAQLASEANRIRGEISAGGTAKLGEGDPAGPAEAFAHVAKLWGTASAGLIRATAIQWAFTDRADASVQPSPTDLKASALQAMAGIVEAAAVSTPPDQAQAVYSDLLKEITIVDRRCGPLSDDVAEACQSALAKLAAKDPALSDRIERYRRATSEPLKWRKMYARQQARNLQQKFPPANRLMTAESKPTSTNRPAFVRRAFGKPEIAPASFMQPASWMVYDAASQLMGKPITETGMVRLSPASGTAVVPFTERHYGNIPVPMSSEAEVGDLQTALVVDETHGPLTVESADAVSAAELHDYTTVSGVVEKVHLEATVTRFAGLPDVAYTLSPLGQVPELGEHAPPLKQTCWRLDLKPMWAHHTYFTVRQKGK